MGCPICDNKPANCDCTATEREQSDEIESLQAEIARLREERRWVPVGKRLSEEELQVLVWGKGWSSPAIGWREHRPHYIIPETIWTLGDEIDRGDPPQDITHWMPLPPGPEGDA